VIRYAHGLRGIGSFVVDAGRSGHGSFPFTHSPSPSAALFSPLARYGNPSGRIATRQGTRCALRCVPATCVRWTTRAMFTD
jgi:hypothetical protein